METFENRVAVVTGAASGIGLALARALAVRGADIVLADVDGAALDRAVADLATSPARVLAVPTDVSDAASVDNLAAKTLDRFGHVHVLCNNAGVTAYGYNCWDAPASTWQWLWDVNVSGVINGLRAFVPHIIAAGEGHVVNTSSMVALRGRPQRGPYTATKHAILGISDCLRIELAEVAPRVGVTVLCPASTITNFRNSARLWPARLGPVAAVGESPGAVPDESEPNRVPASAVAECAIEAIVTGRFLATPHLDTARRAVSDLAAGLEPSPLSDVAGPVRS